MSSSCRLALFAFFLLALAVATPSARAGQGPEAGPEGEGARAAAAAERSGADAGREAPSGRVSWHLLLAFGLLLVAAGGVLRRRAAGSLETDAPGATVTRLEKPAAVPGADRPAKSAARTG